MFSHRDAPGGHGRAIATTLALIIGALGIVPGAGALSPEDAQGPACVDVVDGTGFYASSGEVAVLVRLAGPNCTQFDYEVFAISAEGELALSLGGEFEDGTTLGFQGAVDPATNATVCVYATVSVRGDHHVFDRAPDSGCFELPKDASVHFTGFN